MCGDSDEKTPTRGMAVELRAVVQGMVDRGELIAVAEQDPHTGEMRARYISPEHGPSMKRRPASARSLTSTRRRG
jgi:hypothetical protein